MTTTATLKAGYKMTEIGVIPEDWEVKKLGDIVQFNNGKAHEQFIDDNGNYVVVNSKFISTDGLGKIVIALPSIEEQQAIAKILSDMDTEITALEEKREKYKLVKQGMMQVLLTGKIRLI